jgi:hypothetical protein
MPALTFNHDNEFVNKYDNKFETKKVNWTGPGFSAMTNPTPYQQFDEQRQQQQPQPLMKKKIVNYTAPQYEAYGQQCPQPMQYNQWVNQQDFPLPSHAGWSKDFVKQNQTQCMTPMHLQYGCPPETLNCTYEYPMNKELKWQAPMPVPMPMRMPSPVQVALPMPVPMPIQAQYPQPQPQPMWSQQPQPMWTQQPQPMWTQQPQPMWMQQQQPQWPIQEQYQQEMPYPVQYNKYYKYPAEQPMQYNYNQPMERPQYGPQGLRHTQTTTTKW